MQTALMILGFFWLPVFVLLPIVCNYVLINKI